MEENKLKSLYKKIMPILGTIIITAILTSTYMINKLGDSKEYIGSNKYSKLLTKINMVQSIMDKKYIENEIKEEDLIEGAVKGYVDGLGDEYTVYFSKKEMDEFKTETEGNYVGIGIYMYLNTKDNNIIVLAPIEGSPAEEAGIKTGDIITKINNIEYTGENFEEVANVIKGKQGSKVSIEVNREGEILNFEVERRKVELYPIKSEILHNDIGYIKIQSFDEDVSKKFKDIYNELQKKKIKGLIIDLRNNGGGILEETLEIADYALEKDKTILITKDREQNKEIEKSKKNPIIKVPIVILTNENTASASEVLTAALKENERATVVGDRTYGKGVIQELITLPDKSGLKITIQEYFTPNENKINKIGIEPNIEVSIPEEQSIYNIEKEDDIQLKEALNVFK